MGISLTPSTTTSSATSGSSNSANSVLGGGGALGQQQFLQLLVAQLKNQDPMQPMDNTQFVAELAQFSSLEALQQIESNQESSLGSQLLSQAMSLLGHKVTAKGSNGSPVTATVQGIQMKNSDVLLDLGSTTVHLSDVQEITN
ncbi:MAG TPA: flagellar hook capping FlgD N-terminal domain-containing protein [Chloroflexota bacterium]|nr:flagellar hook capping FlgD N-terminal domain-containing protein [Chloroflexota bacterium]